MKLSIQDRIELSRISRSHSSNNIEEIETLKSISDKITISHEDRVKLGIIESVQGYQIGFEQDNDYLFSKEETELLGKLYELVKTNQMINLNNLSLMKKIKEA